MRYRLSRIPNIVNLEPKEPPLDDKRPQAILNRVENDWHFLAWWSAPLGERRLLSGLAFFVGVGNIQDVLLFLGFHTLEIDHVLC